MAEIDREKVIKGLECCMKFTGEPNTATCHCSDCSYTNMDIFGQRCLIDLINDALALLKEQEWKLITEDSDGILHGLPGDDGTYLMTDGENIWIDDYVDGVDDGVWLDSGRDIREIKAWMYMPKLPEQKGR